MIRNLSRLITCCHILETHTGERPYPCPDCDKRFKQSGALKAHVRTHTGEKPYSCPHCDKRYRQPNLLKGHLRIHTGEKPHICPLCGNRFSQVSILNAHLKTHAGEKLHACTPGKNYFTPTSIKIKQESDNSTQDETYNYIDRLTELTHESNEGTNYVEQQPDTSGVDVIKSESDLSTSEQSYGHTIISEEIDDAHAATSNQCNTGVNFKLETDLDQQPIHTAEKEHVRRMTKERRVREVKSTKPRRTNTRDQLNSCIQCGNIFNRFQPPRYTTNDQC